MKENITIFCENAYKKKSAFKLLFLMSCEFFCGYYLVQKVFIAKNGELPLLIVFGLGFILSALFILMGKYYTVLLIKTKNTFTLDKEKNCLSLSDGITDTTYTIRDFIVDAAIAPNKNGSTISLSADYHTINQKGRPDDHSITRKGGEWRYIMTNDDALRFLSFLGINTDIIAGQIKELERMNDENDNKR